MGLESILGGAAVKIGSVGRTQEVIHTGKAGSGSSGTNSEVMMDGWDTVIVWLKDLGAE